MAQAVVVISDMQDTKKIMTFDDFKKHMQPKVEAGTVAKPVEILWEEALKDPRASKSKDPITGEMRVAVMRVTA